MKKSFFLGGLLAFCIILLFNTNLDKQLKEKSDFLDWQDNILIRLNEKIINYETIENNELKDLNVKEKGILKTYNLSKNIFVFLVENNIEIYENQKKINTIALEGELEDLKLSPLGEYLLFKDKGKTNYEILNIKQNKVSNLNDSILLSGNIIDFMEDGRIICYGVRVKDKKMLYLFII